MKIFSRKGVEKDERARQIEDAELFMMEKNLKDEIRILQDERDKRIEDLLDGQDVAPRTSSTSRGEKSDQEGPGAHPRGAAEAAPLRHPEAARQGHATTRTWTSELARSWTRPSARSRC